MQCELVDVLTVDGIRLHGAWFRSAVQGPLTGTVVMTQHGVGGNFYSTHLFRYGTELLLRRGADVVWTNNRGHDGWSVGAAGPKRGSGAAFESVDDCRLDLAAWLDRIRRERDPDHCVLWGHSLGAVKSIYASVQEAAPPVSAIIATSPPVLSYTRLSEGSRASEFIETIAFAERTLAEDPERLIQVRLPFPLWIAARAYWDKYGPQERFNVLRLAERLRVPTLFAYGALELERPTDPFASVEAAIAFLSKTRPWIEFVEVPRANHFYAHGAEFLGDSVSDFLERVLRR